MITGAGVGRPHRDRPIKGEKLNSNYVSRRRKALRRSAKKGSPPEADGLCVSPTSCPLGAEKVGVKAAVPAPVPVTTMAEAAPAPKAAKKAAPPRPRAAPVGRRCADDLKQLSGVGPALEKKLHDAGVTTFAQIAAWGPEEIAEFDEKLSFKGRIEREGWVDQAKTLAAG